MATITQINSRVFIDGEEIKNPPPSTFGNCIIQNGNRIFINGYRYNPKTKKFKFHIWAWIEYALS